MFGLNVTQLMAVGVGGALLLVALRWVVLRESDRVIRRIIVTGFAAKLVGTAAYYWVIAEIYGRGDVTGYIARGRELAPIIRSGTLPDQAQETGTQFMQFLTGVVFAVMGPNEIVGYLVFSMLSFAGMLAFLSALRLAAPTANHRRYAFLVLLIPTMVFWPSTIGKEAWLVFTLGFGSYGVARVLTRSRFGYVLLTVSVVAMGAVRPHMAALFSVSFAFAYLVHMADRDVRRNTAAWVGLVLVGGLVVFATTTFSDEMGGGDVEQGSTVDRLRADTEAVFERTDQNTRRGGSEFDSRPVEGPADFLHAVVTVPFRPFPHEAHNRQAQLISLEGLFLMGLAVLAIPQLMRLPRLVLRRPYLAFATVYSLGFIVAFSNVGNFGILTRQRAQLLPLLFVLLAVALQRRRAGQVQGPPLVPAPPVDRDAEGLDDHERNAASKIGSPSQRPVEPGHDRSVELLVDLPPGSVEEGRSTT